MNDELPDMHDGLTRLERTILLELAVLQGERDREFVPTIMLYGRVVEHVDVSRADFRAALRRLMGSS